MTTKLKTALALGVSLATVAFGGSAPAPRAVDELSRAIRNFQDLDTWHASTDMLVNGKTAKVLTNWNGSQMVMDVTTIEGKRYMSRFEKGKSYLSPDGKKWGADDEKTAEQQMTLVLSGVNWDGKGSMPGKYDWAGPETVNGEKTQKITGTSTNGRPAVYWIYDHPKYGKSLLKFQADMVTTGGTVFRMTTTFSDPFNKNPHPQK